MTLPGKRRTNDLVLTILWVGLLVGFLDIAAAIINFKINSNKSPIIIFQIIASAAFGKVKAFSGDISMIILGALLHFLIAYCFTILFFLIYHPLRLHTKNALATGILYGIFIWCVMNLIVLPLALTHKFPDRWNEKTLVDALILITAIGVPLSFLTGSYFRKEKNVELQTLARS